VLRFVRPWGPFATGEELRLPSGDGSLAERSARLAAAAGSEVVAIDAAGEPALVVASRGAGHAVVCAHPLELLLARRPDAHGPDDRSAGVYAGLAALAGAADPARVRDPGDPEVTTGTLLGPAGGIVALTNHGADARRVLLRLPDDAIEPVVHGPGGVVPAEIDSEGPVVVLPGHGAAIISWARR